MQKQYTPNLKVRPVCGHSRTVGVFPPAEVLLLIDGQQCVVQLTVHSFYTKKKEFKVLNHILSFNFIFILYIY